MSIVGDAQGNDAERHPQTHNVCLVCKKASTMVVGQQSNSTAFARCLQSIQAKGRKDGASDLETSMKFLTGPYLQATCRRLL